MTFKDKPKRDGGKTFSRDNKPKGPGKPAAEREKKSVEAKAAPAQEAVIGTEPSVFPRSWRAPASLRDAMSSA